MSKVKIGLCCAMALWVAAPVLAFTTHNGTEVNPVDDDVFEVVPRSSGTIDDFWCGASDYARIVLGAGWQDRLYAVRGRGVSTTTGKRSSAQFSLSPDRVSGGLPVEPRWLILGLRAGDSMSVQQAQVYCQKIPDRF